jgi:hypothetical protein
MAYRAHLRIEDYPVDDSARLLRLDRRSGHAVCRHLSGYSGLDHTYRDRVGYWRRCGPQSLRSAVARRKPGGEKEANWLPVDKKPFTLLMRLYSPKAEFLSGSWTPPPVVRSRPVADAAVT